MRQTYQLQVNGQKTQVRVTPDTPLLWVLRDALGLTGSKYGCGAGLCGACTVHVDGVAQRSCVLPIDRLPADATIRTIEGVVETEPDHPVLKAWQALDVPQCGYCQTGQIMTAIGFLEDNPDPTNEDIRDGMTNYCRCGTYNLIAEAIAQAAKDK